ncbi:MAG: nucleotidyltransferase [Flavobacteriaceae bacterium]|nr:nucleotidyltransferase [Flavobacteriaceae bacterium]
MWTDWDENISSFIQLADKHHVRMLMVGGGAVSFHGYKRHSADVDFWIETTPENFKKLMLVFMEMGYEITDFPTEVKEQRQNISVKFFPSSLNLELITNFSVNKPFSSAYKDSIEASLVQNPLVKWRVLSYEDLIVSKIKSSRPKDLLDIQELKRINEK